MKIREAGQQVASVFHRSSTASAPLSPTEMAQAHDHEKDFVAHYCDALQPMAPGEVDAKNKELGKSSKGLGVRDFELVRTLGTGTQYIQFFDSVLRWGFEVRRWM